MTKRKEILEIMKYKNIPIKELNLENLVDIDSIKFKKNLSEEDKLFDYIKKTKNPYAFKVNNKIVKISYLDTNKSAKDCLLNVIKSLYK